MDAEDVHPSRRSLLKTGLAAAGAAIGVSAEAHAALRAGAEQSRSAAVVTGRRFRGWVSRGSGRGRTTLQELTLRPIAGRQVVVRTEATNLCYSNTGAVLGLGQNFGGRLNTMALIQGHGGVGVVEAVGPEVRRVQVGDRVCVSGTPQCGSCYQCLRGRADMCQFLGRQGPDDLVPIADMRDGTAVYANS
ncbi:MAG TPA: alcohol dehydrogenase catalytic domain-containing protein, partial [Vicinamibacterales bacterium]